LTDADLAHRGLHPRAKTAREKLGGGLGPTPQTCQSVLSVLGHFGFAPRQFRYLMPNRLSSLAQQQRPTLVTRRRLQVNHVLHLLP